MGGDRKEVKRILKLRRDGWDAETIDLLFRWGATPRLHAVQSVYTVQKETCSVTNAACVFVEPSGRLIEHAVVFADLRQDYRTHPHVQRLEPDGAAGMESATEGTTADEGDSAYDEGGEDSAYDGDSADDEGGASESEVDYDESKVGNARKKWLTKLGGHQGRVNRILDAYPDKWNADVIYELLRWGAKPRLKTVTAVIEDTFKKAKCIFVDPSGRDVPCSYPFGALRHDYAEHKHVKHFVKEADASECAPARKE